MPFKFGICIHIIRVYGTVWRDGCGSEASNDRIEKLVQCIFSWGNKIGIETGSTGHDGINVSVLNEMDVGGVKWW